MLQIDETLWSHIPKEPILKEPIKAVIAKPTIKTSRDVEENKI